MVWQDAVIGVCLSVCSANVGPNDVQLEFVMLDPYVRTALQHDGQVQPPP